MRILITSIVDYLGGAENVLLDFLDTDTTNEYVVATPSGELSKECATRGIKTITNSGLSPLQRRISWLPNPFKFLSIITTSNNRLRKACRELDIDILYANTLNAGFYTFWVSIFSGNPLVWHVHDIKDSYLLSFILRFFVYLNSKIHFVCVSQAVADSRALNRLPKNRVSVIYNGLDACNNFAPKQKKQTITKDKLSILMYGRILPWKGFHVFLESISRLDTSQLGRIQCTIAGGNKGNPAYYDSLEETVKIKGLESIVHFIDEVKRENIPHLLSNHDIVVHASTKPDPLPTVVLEAMAMKKLVIASNVGGVPEMISDERDGFLFPPGNSDALYEKLRNVLNNPEVILLFGNRAREKVLLNFNISKKRQGMIDLFLRLKQQSDR